MLIALIIATVTDIKKREIPIWLFPLISVLFLIFHQQPINLTFSIVGCLIGIAAFTIMALFFEGGGGDIIMMGSIGLMYGPIALAVIITISSFLCLIYRLYSKATTVPYAPFVLLAYILFFIGGCFYGINSFRNVVWSYFLLC